MENSKHNILITSDDIEVAERVRQLLAQHFNLVKTRTGEEALAASRNHNIHLIIADNEALNAGAANLLAKVKAGRPDATGILLIERADLPATLKAIESGCVDRYILEPWADDELRLAVKAELQKRDILIANRRLQAEMAKKDDELSASTEELRKALGELKDVQTHIVMTERLAAIGQLAAGLAHEIRNPLSAIRNAVYDIGELVEVNNLVREDLDIVSEEIERINRILENLLEFSRSSKQTRELTNVNKFLNRTLALIQKHLQSNDIEVEKSFSDVPLCLVNPDNIKQAFLNIIFNALQAMPDGGRLRISTSIYNSDKVRIEFSDTGVGISEQDLENIFNPFFTTKERGTGLGLSMVHSIITEHGGAISVESEKGKGAKFGITLPAGERR